MSPLPPKMKSDKSEMQPVNRFSGYPPQPEQATTPPRPQKKPTAEEESTKPEPKKKKFFKKEAKEVAETVKKSYRSAFGEEDRTAGRRIAGNEEYVKKPSSKSMRTKMYGKNNEE